MEDTVLNTADTTIHVLLVDDQPIIAEGISRMLEGEKDIVLHYCQDPSSAINMAVEVNAKVILQDLVMPDVDGMTLVRFYKANNTTKDIPVIVLSSREDPVVKSDAFSFGASDYLVKLPDRIELIARIRAHARNYIMQVERDAAFYALRQMQKQLEESNRRLQQLSLLDGLTGIANRRHFDTTLQQEFAKARKMQTPLSLILIDIDSFKKYNDTYGHLAGDDCLIKVARTINAKCNHDDDLAARYGGEEFVVLLPNTTEKTAIKVAERIRTTIEQLCIEHKSTSTTTACITLSMGLATLEHDSVQDEQALIELADRALYHAKENGRNRIVMASELS